MATASLAQPACATTRNVEQIAERVEAEFTRLKEARPALLSRIKRAEDLFIVHVSCHKQDTIKPRIRGGELVAYLIKGSAGQVYRVYPHSWQCSCPDAHRRGKGCKHALLCYALWRAYQKHVTTTAEVVSIETARTKCVSCSDRFRGRDLIEVGDDHLTFFEGDRLCRSCAIVHGIL